MKRISRIGLLSGPKITLAILLLIPVALIGAETEKGPMQESTKPPEEMKNPGKLADAQWRARLSPEQYRVLRQAGTEQANGPIYQQFKHQGSGTYYCAACGAKLFSSDQKFDSRCGWPSFWDPATIDSVETRVDNSLGIPRIEVICANCKSHLGHLFKGEGFDTPTDQRFCINGTALVFVPDEPKKEDEKKD